MVLNEVETAMQTKLVRLRSIANHVDVLLDGNGLRAFDPSLESGGQLCSWELSPLLYHVKGAPPSDRADANMCNIQHPTFVVRENSLCPFNNFCYMQRQVPALIFTVGWDGKSAC